MESILLDPANYNSNTHSWNVPILSLPRVNYVSFYIDGREIPTNEYNVKKNQIHIAEKNEITVQTKAYLMIEVRPGAILVKFWLPIILALLGIVSQVVPGLPHIYNSSSNSMLTYWFNPMHINYNTADSNFTFNIEIQERGIAMIPPEQFKDYQLILFIKGYKNGYMSDPASETYDCLSEPLQIYGTASGFVKPDRHLINNMLCNLYTKVRLVMVVMRKDKIPEAKENRTLRNMPKDDYKIVRSAVYNMQDGCFEIII